MTIPAGLSAVLGRTEQGHALCAVRMTDAERDDLRGFLAQAVVRQGVAGLAAPREHIALFALFGAEFLASQADALVWGPMLAALGARGDQLERYPLLYDPLEQHLASVGRPVRRTSSQDRRFLGSLLREGGLPARIGDLAQRVRPLIERYGWDALNGEEARELLAQEVAQAAKGAVRNVLEGKEGVAALAGLLDDVRLTRLQLVRAGVDPTSLGEPQQVRAALEQARISLPSVRNESLLLALLGSFNVRTPKGQALASPARLVLRLAPERARLAVRYELADLTRIASLENKSHVALVARPSIDRARLAIWAQGGVRRAAHTHEPFVEWRRDGARSPTTIEARTVDDDGSTHIEPVDLLEWPSDPVLWFSAAGERLCSEPDSLAAGAQVYLLVQDDTSVEAEGAVSVNRLPETCTLRTFRVNARGEGVLRLQGQGGGYEIACGHSAFAVELIDDVLLGGALSTKVRRRLPTIALPAGGEATLSVAGVDGRFVELRRAKGLLRLANEPGVSGRSGVVRVRLRTDTGESWSARWSVLPEGLTWRSEGGALVVETPPGVVVEAINADIAVAHGRSRVTPHAVRDRVELRLRLASGEVLALPVVAPRPGVSLRKAPDFSPQLLGGQRLTEREILEGAHLAVNDGEGASLEVLTRSGERVLRAVQRNVRPSHVTLDAVLEAQRRDKEYRLPLRAVVRGASGETAAEFEVVIPRRSDPKVTAAEGELRIRIMVDPEDVPRAPMLALFPVLDPLAEPAFIRCSFTSEGEFGTASLPVNHLPTTRGPYVTALVEGEGRSPRSMSGCRLISVPLGANMDEPPPGLDALRGALWRGQTREMSTEIDRRAVDPALPSWLELLEQAAHTRANYGLFFFKFFDAIIGESPWVIVAIAARMTPPERAEWFSMWAREPSFTWLRFRRKDADLLTRMLPSKLRSEEKAQIVAAAEAARPMPLTVRQMIEQAFFRGESARPIAFAHSSELGVGGSARLPRDWARIALPKPGSLAQRWMFGLDLAADQWSQVDDQLAQQLLRGQRVRAIRAAFERLRAWREDFTLFQVNLGTTPVAPWASPILAECAREWGRALGGGSAPRGDGVRERLRRVDEDALHAAILLTEWREGSSFDSRTHFAMVQKLERLVPDLLGAWLAALACISALDGLTGAVSTTPRGDYAMSRFHLEAYGALEGVHEAIASFLRSSFRFADEKLDRAVHETVRRFGLLAPPVVEATFPYEEPTSGPATVEDLGKMSVFHRDLWSILDAATGDARWPRERRLYKHQVEAFRAYHEGRSLVVSSGTGSGKTECFLLPAIDMLLRDEDLRRPGVRVLIVYPLNALVNNQMDRLRALLGHHSSIRFGLYTSRLVETEAEAQRKAKALGETPWPAEIHSRERLRSEPPHILVTNYSMLEYALVRSADAPIFAPSLVKPKLVVLDEAHVYAGAMAAEITLLLRRAWLRWGLERAPKGIVTSATMHQGVDDGIERLETFASDLLSKPRRELKLVLGKRALPSEAGDEVAVPLPDAETVCTVDTDIQTLREDTAADGSVTRLEEGGDACAKARQAANTLVPGAKLEPSAAAAPLLYAAFEPLAWVRALRRELHGKVMRLDELASGLFPQAERERAKEATLRLLELLALARRSANEIPLLPVRLHATVRGPHGVFACINPMCPMAAVPGRLGRLYADPTERCECGSYVAELQLCNACGQSFLVAAEGVDEDDVPALRPSVRHHADLFVGGTTWDDGTPLNEGKAVRVVKNGRIGAGTSGTALRMFPGGGINGHRAAFLNADCPKCGAHSAGGRSVIRRVEAGPDAVLQVVVDGLYPHLPEHKAASDDTPGRGRRALLFADNRQTAASLAAKIEESHDLILSRSLIREAINKSYDDVAVDPEAASLLNRAAVALRRGDRSAAAALMAQIDAEDGSSTRTRSVAYMTLVNAVAERPAFRELAVWRRSVSRDHLAAMILVRELGRRPSRGGNLEASGVVSVEYNMEPPRPADPDIDAVFAGDLWTSLIYTVLDTVRTGGAVAMPAMTHEMRELVPTWLMSRWLVERAQAEGDEEDEYDVEGVSPSRHVALRPRPGGENRRSVYLRRVLEALGAPPTVQPANVLTEIWALLWRLSDSPNSLVIRHDRSERVRLLFEGLSFRPTAGGKLFRCPRCRTHWSRQVANMCPSYRCAGTLVSVEGSDLNDRLASASENPSSQLGLRTKEHTAQIGIKELENFESAFRAGVVNVLVCSTTMELGIDIGGLSATILTNVPPGPANYLQRAGRAGRRTEGTSLVLTYARPRPFDQAAFTSPERPFRAPIRPPKVKLDSSRIVQRHANAVLLSRFFARTQAFAEEGNPMSAFGTLQSFVEEELNVRLARAPNLLLALQEELSIDGAQSTLSDAFVSWLDVVIQEDEETCEAVSKIVAGTALEAIGIERVVAEARQQICKIMKHVLDQIDVLKKQQEEAEGEAPRDEGRVMAIEITLAELRREKLLAYLAEEQFLPRYGFPVQVARLHESWRRRNGSGGARSPSDVTRDDPHIELRLERDVTVALSEYAPGAEVVAGKYVHASRGLQRHWTGADKGEVLPMRVLGVCDNCGRLQSGRNEGEIRTACPTCGGESVRSIPVVYPKNGFAVKWGESPRRWISGARPPARPVTEATYAAKDGDSAVAVSDALSLSYDEQGNIIVRSEGDLAPSDLNGDLDRGGGGPRAGLGYAICYACGRAEPESQPRRGMDDPLPTQLRNHDRLRGERACTGAHRYWRHVALAGAVQTETLRFVLAPLLSQGVSPQARRLATTLMVALQLSGAELLGIDSREISGILSPRQASTGPVFDIVLYDQRPGGSGHCKALMDQWGELIDAVRQRLQCPDGSCATACPKCLLAYETQRHMDSLDRRALEAFLAGRWESLSRRVVRDGLPVARLLRGAAELAEAIGRADDQPVTVFVEQISPGALEEHGWLRRLLRHGSGRRPLRIVTTELPSPEDDRTRFLASRLCLAVQGGEMELYSCSIDQIGMMRWRVLVGERNAFFVEGETRAGLGAAWLEAATVHRAVSAKGFETISARTGEIMAKARLVKESELAPKPLSKTMVIHNVAKNLSGGDATFERWLVGPDGRTSLFARPLAQFSVVDPYLATEWQLRLLEELVDLAKKAGKPKIKVETYAPKASDGYMRSGPHAEKTPEEQRLSIGKIIGDPGWTPMPTPMSNLDKVHKRVIKGLRADGTGFEVLLERGLDFISTGKHGTRGGRVTRETYLVVRDPV